MPMIAATIGPATPPLAGVDMVRVNGAFGTQYEMSQLIRPYLPSVAKVLDIPNGRKKVRTNAYQDDELVDLARHHFDFIALSYVCDAGSLKYSFPTIAKIETLDAITHLDEIAEKAAMLLVDRRDLATAIGITNLPHAIDDITSACGRTGKPLILASEYLISMLHNNEPTLSEAMDVWHAQADYLLLAEETALSPNAQYIVNVARSLMR